MKVSEIVLSGSMVGTAEVEEGQDLYRFPLKKRRWRNFMLKRWEHKTQARHNAGSEMVMLIALNPGS